MTRSRTVVAVVLVAALVGAVGTAVAVGGDAGASANRTITVAGTGDVEVAPDAAVVRVSVTASGSDAGNVSQQVADDAAALREAMAEFGLDDDDVRSVNYDIHSDRDRPESGPYEARQTFELALDDVDRAGDLIDAAVEAGADDVRGVSFTLSEESRDQARDRALRNAVENARGEAEVLADVSELDLGGVHAVSTTGTDVRPYRMEAVAFTADAGGASTQIDSRDVTVTAHVEVVFGAEAA